MFSNGSSIALPTPSVSIGPMTPPRRTSFTRLGTEVASSLAEEPIVVPSKEPKGPRKEHAAFPSIEGGLGRLSRPYEEKCSGGGAVAGATNAAFGSASHCAKDFGITVAPGGSRRPLQWCES